ncbi:HET-domain-containing protein, partial [Melanomma pulvis-pyrius CBS 109.77]
RKHPGAFRYTWGDFEALSYTWGDGDNTRKILLNGICKEVSNNLEEALRTLRSLRETELGMRYWVDSLCIDQDNLCERNHQVKRMRDIYSRARAVIVWLGREEGVDRDAVKVMHNLCRNPHTNPLLIARQFPRNEWDALCAFMERPYWNRSWIIQELAMNHNSTLLLCGKLKLTRRMIRMGVVFWQEILRVSGYETHQSDHYLDSESALWLSASRVYRLIKLTSDSHLEGRLDELLNLVRRADATDKKDKIYGILGLLEATISSKIIPDYSLSEQQVYTEFMISLVSTTKRLEKIIYGGISLEKGWPSWVPDWRLPFKRHHLRHLRCCQASRSLPDSIRFSRNGKKDLLSCSGFIVDNIDGVGAWIPPQSSPRPSLGPGFVQPENASNRYGSNISQALWRTLLMNHPGGSDDSSLLDVPWGINFHSNSEWATMSKMGYFRKFHEFREANKEFRIGGQSFRNYFSRFRRADMKSADIGKQMRLAILSLQERTLITTITGYLGLAPNAVLQGDVVAILSGCNFPVVLRPCGNLYEAVGECYVHGLMNGE